MNGLIAVYVVGVIVSVMMVVSGFGLRYWMRRRAFNRRNLAAVEEFKSFEHAEASRYLEGAVKFVGALMMVFGGMTTLALVPLILIMLFV